MRGSRDVFIALALIGISVAILAAAIAAPSFSPGTMQPKPSVTPVREGVVEYYKTNGTALPNVVINVTFLSTKSSPVYIVSASVNGVPMNITWVADKYNNSKSTWSADPKLVPIEPGLNNVTIKGVLSENLNLPNDALLIVQVMLSDGEVVTVPSLFKVVNVSGTKT